jgi:hypothetical protein
MRWEDKLQGQKFRVLTNHHSLKWLKTQRGLSCRQVQRLEYLGQFNFEIAYIAGNDNVAADALLQRYKSNISVDNWAPHEFVNTDSCLDPEGRTSWGSQ